MAEIVTAQIRICYRFGMLDTLQLQLLLATFAAWANRKQARIIAYLIEESSRSSSSRAGNASVSPMEPPGTPGRFKIGATVLFLSLIHYLPTQDPSPAEYGRAQRRMYALGMRGEPRGRGHDSPRPGVPRPR